MKEDLQNLTADVKQVVDEIQMAIADAIGGDRGTIDSARLPVDRFVLNRPVRVDVPATTENERVSSPTDSAVDVPSLIEDDPISPDTNPPDYVPASIDDEPISSSSPDPPNNAPPSTDDEPTSSSPDYPVYVPSSTEDEQLFTTPTTTATTPFIIPLITDPTLPVESFTRPIPSDMRTTTVPPSWTSTRGPPTRSPARLPSTRPPTHRPTTWTSTRGPPTRVPPTWTTTRRIATRPPITPPRKCHRPSATAPKTIQNQPKQNTDEISITIEGNNYKSWQDWKTQDFQIAFNIAKNENNLSINSKSR